MLRLPLLLTLATLAAALAPTRCLPRTRCLRCCELPSETTGSSLEEDGQAEARKPEATISLAQWMVGMNTSPRRIVTATLSSTAIALAANFLGVTSGLLSLFPEAAREQRLDIAYPVRGFKRHLDPQGRYTFIFPVRYVADQTVYMRNADAAYTRRTQDPLLAASGLRATPAAKSSGPDVAFGPPGTSAEENLSVVSGPLRPGSSLLGTLGPPEQAADKLLRERIAKQGEREVTLPRRWLGVTGQGWLVRGGVCSPAPAPAPAPTT